MNGYTLPLKIIYILLKFMINNLSKLQFSVNIKIDMIVINNHNLHEIFIRRVIDENWEQRLH